MEDFWLWAAFYNYRNNFFLGYPNDSYIFGFDLITKETVINIFFLRFSMVFLISSVN